MHQRFLEAQVAIEWLVNFSLSPRGRKINNDHVSYSLVGSLWLHPTVHIGASVQWCTTAGRSSRLLPHPLSTQHRS